MGILTEQQRQEHEKSQDLEAAVSEADLAKAYSKNLKFHLSIKLQIKWLLRIF